MPYQALAIDKYNFKPDDKLFIDANIWMYIYGPQKPSDSKVNIYSQALAKILAAKSLIHIDVLIVSEFINSYARSEWKINAPQVKNFKDFRRSSSFKPIALNIADSIKRVLAYCSRIESGFDMLDVNVLIDEYSQGDSDFNDQIIFELCKKNRFKLITDDGDFKGKCISVVTANNHLLS